MDNNIIIDELLVDNEIDDDYLCLICQGLLVNNLQCQEGHLACRDCFTKIVKDKKECMTCRCEIKSIESLSKNRYLEKEIRKLNIYCPNSFFRVQDQKNNEDQLSSPQQQTIPPKLDKENGCNEIITIDQLESHLKQCEFKFMKCPNLYDSSSNDENENDSGHQEFELILCDEEYRCNKQIEHNNNCKFAIIGCNQCGKDYCRKDIENHKLSKCPNLKVNCKHCNKSEILKSELQSHLNLECPEIEIECIFKKGGCNQLVKRDQMKQHLALYTNNHFQFIQNTLNEQQQQIDNLTLKLNNLNTNTSTTTSSNSGNDSNNNNNLFYSGKWTILNWNEKLQKYPAKKYFSLNFNMSPDKPFSIRVYPNGSSIMWHNCTISLVKEFQKECLIAFSFEIENLDPTKNNEQKKTDTFKGIGDSWSLQFYKLLEDSGFRNNNSVTINFTVKIKKCFDYNYITD